MAALDSLAVGFEANPGGKAHRHQADQLSENRCLGASRTEKDGWNPLTSRLVLSISGYQAAFSNLSDGNFAPRCAMFRR
jgi:hypothetical protein